MVLNARSHIPIKESRIRVSNGKVLLGDPEKPDQRFMKERETDLGWLCGMESDSNYQK